VNVTVDKQVFFPELFSCILPHFNKSNAIPRRFSIFVFLCFLFFVFFSQIDQWYLWLALSVNYKLKTNFASVILTF